MRPTREYFIRMAKAAAVCAVWAAFSMPAATPDPGTAVNVPWDWSGVIGTGQSLAVGEKGWPLLPRTSRTTISNSRPGICPGRLIRTTPIWCMVPLVEPVGRHATNYPSSWPDNIAGETPHSAMANEITALVRTASGRDFIGVHGEVGENGQGMIYLKKNAQPKGVNGRSYEAAMIETKAITRLAKAAGKTYGVGAITVTHGESDAGNRNYENELHQLWTDYNADFPAITGQKQKIQMIVSQQNSCATVRPPRWRNGRSAVDYPADIVCSGPKYQYPSAEGIHLTADGYRQLGEKYGQVYYQRVILGRDWQPLQPNTVERQGAVITVRFHVPVPPLVWDTTFEPPHPSIEQWKNGKGFEVNTAGGDKVAIASVAISGDAVVITCASDPGPGARVGYAMIGEKTRMAAPFEGTYRWGLLRDSDPFIGAGTGKAQPNYCVAFELSAP